MSLSRSSSPTTSISLDRHQQPIQVIDLAVGDQPMSIASMGRLSIKLAETKTDLRNCRIISESLTNSPHTLSNSPPNTFATYELTIACKVHIDAYKIDGFLPMLSPPEVTRRFNITFDLLKGVVKERRPHYSLMRKCPSLYIFHISINIKPALTMP